MNKILFLTIFAASFSYAFAEDFPLDPPYKNLQHPTTSFDFRIFDNNSFITAPKSDTLSLVAKQSPVRAQLHRGTCSIFSATAMLEAQIIINNLAKPNAVDLSEEWLEYQKARITGRDGSSSPQNYSIFKSYGSVGEEFLPYIGEEWEESTSGLAKTRCGFASGFDKKKCLIGHRHPALFEADEQVLLDPTNQLFDPDFAKARTEAKKFFDTYISGKIDGSYYVFSTEETKKMLDEGIPVTLDINFYYGAWNHRLAPEIGVDRNMDHWERGIVGYPEVGSIDLERSYEKPAGHSILVVGYDDSVVIETTIQMTDGTRKAFRHKGVYYFKNSWGTGSFGVRAAIDGTPTPGYGMITQDYAHNFGQFFKLPYKN